MTEDIRMLSRKNSKTVHTLIMEQIKDVEICLVCFENFMRVATQPESKQESLRALSQELVQKEFVYFYLSCL